MPNSTTPLFAGYFPRIKNVIQLIDLFFEYQFFQKNNETEKLFTLFLQNELDVICKHSKDCDGVFLKDKIFEELIFVQNKLLIDAQFILESDPASKSLEEVILCYPGFYAVAVYRFAHIFNQLQVPLMGRMMSEYAHNKTGIDIHPSAQIGTPFFIDHGTGVVIGETSIIGNRVKMYQGVTLGALQVNKCDASAKRHPSIEDEVVMYANCCVLGGDTVIGKKSIIGANTFITKSIPAASTVYTKSTIEFKQSKDHFELMYDI